MHQDAIPTERLTLRQLDLADAARLAPLLKDPSIARMTTHVPHPHCALMVEGWILIGQARRPLGKDHVFGLDLSGEGLIGVIGAHAKAAAVEIGYWIGAPYRGRGFATEAAQAITRFAEGLGRGPVEAGHFADNPGSGRVLEKAGFRYTGVVDEAFSLGRRARAPVRRMVYHPQAARAAA